MKKPLIFVTAASAVAVLALGSLWWYSREHNDTGVSGEHTPSSESVFFAGLTRKLDGIKLDHAASAQSPGILTKAGIERLLAKKASLSVQELRRRIAAGTRSTDPLQRARALLLAGEFDSALKAIATVKAPDPGDLIPVLEVQALAYEGKFRHQDGLTARRKIARLTDRKKDPAGWATAQRMVAQALARADTARENEPDSAAAIAAAPPLPAPPPRDPLPDTRGQKESALTDSDHQPAPAAIQPQPGPEVLQPLQDQSNLAAALMKQGKNAEAEAVFRDLLAARQRVLGPQNPETLATWSDLALALQKQGRHGEAEEILRATAAVWESAIGPEHPGTLASRRSLAAALTGQGKTAEAEAIFRTVLAEHQRLFGQEDAQTLISHSMLAMNLAAQGDGFHRAGNQNAARACWTDALEHARTSYDVRQRVLPGDTRELTLSRSIVTGLEAKLK